MCCGNGQCERCRPKGLVYKTETHYVSYRVTQDSVKEFLKSLDPGANLDGFRFSDVLINTHDGTISFSLDAGDGE